jgi:TonB-like protein
VRTTPFFRSHHVRVSAAGIAGTVLLHILFVLPLFLDLSLPSPRLPNKSGTGASALASAEEPIMTAVFINEPSPAERTAPPSEDLASRGLEPLDMPVMVLSPDAIPAVQVDETSEKSQDSSAPPEAAADQTQHALLYGRYLMQIQARIERAWMRPRAEIGADRFSCRTRIEQDRRGDVVGIKLDHCNGTERWQQSLVSAIRTASPLPAPPDAAVYADRLWLGFESDGFQSGKSAQGFEPESRESLLAAEQAQGRESFEHFADRALVNFKSSGMDNSDVIHLTIVGSPASPPPTTPAAAPPVPDSDTPPPPQ